MNKKLHILHLEDSKADAEIIQAKLAKEGLECEITLVVTREDFTNALEQSKFDVILSDYDLPSFEGLAALRIAKARCPDVPFIFVTGQPGEECAIENLKEGASDYVLKGNLTRLVPAINGALEDAKLVVERKRAEEALQESEEKFRGLYESSRDALMTLEPPSWAFTSGNPATVAMFKAKNEEDFIFHAPWQLSPERQPDGRASGEKAGEMIETAMREGSHFFEWTHKRIDGEEFPATVLLTRMGPAGRRYLQATVRDVTLYRQAEKALFDSEAYLKTIMATIQAGVMVIDVEKHTIAEINEAAANLIGVKREDLIGKECHRYICPAEKGKCPIIDLNQIVDRSERVVRNYQGEEIPILKTVVPLTIKGRKYLIESFIDISERKRMEEELKIVSITDNMTQSYNRTKYEEVIKREIERTKRSGSPLSIVLFDIDHFKKVNDTCGHDVGDYVLKTLSQMVKKKIRGIDYLVRWGGEEFVVIALDTDLRGAEVMAEKIRLAIGNFSFDKVGRVTASFGVTQFTQDDTEDSFMKRADDALYKAKEKGRDRVEAAP